MPTRSPQRCSRAAPAAARSTMSWACLPARLIRRPDSSPTERTSDRLTGAWHGRWLARGLDRAGESRLGPAPADPGLAARLCSTPDHGLPLPGPDAALCRRRLLPAGVRLVGGQAG